MLQLTRKQINLLHVLIIGPLAVYIGYYGSKSHPQSFMALLVLAVYAIVYHGSQYMAYN